MLGKVCFVVEDVTKARILSINVTVLAQVCVRKRVFLVKAGQSQRKGLVMSHLILDLDNALLSQRAGLDDGDAFRGQVCKHFLSKHVAGVIRALHELSKRQSHINKEELPPPLSNLN